MATSSTFKKLRVVQLSRGTRLLLLSVGTALLLLEACDPYDKQKTEIVICSAHLRLVYISFASAWSHGTNRTVSEVIKVVGLEKGSNYLRCPVHGGNYQLNSDPAIWDHPEGSGNKVAVYCDRPHVLDSKTAIYTSVTFDGSTPHLLERPKW